MSQINLDSLIMTVEEKDLFTRYNYLNEELKDINNSIEQIKKQSQLLSDALEESMLAEDEEGNLMLSCGSIFVQMGFDSVEERLSKMSEDAQKEQDKLEEERNEKQTELEEIKKKLYARFGDLVVLG